MTTTEMVMRVKALERDVEELDKIIVRGNGKPSLQEDVRTIMKFIKDEEESRKYWSRLVVGAMVTNFLGYGVAALVWFLKIWPVIERLNREVVVR